MVETVVMYSTLEQNFIAWAQAQPEIRAAVVVGSRSRQEHPADAYSDLDLVVFVTTAEPFISRTGWLAQIGEVWLSVLNCTGRGDPEWLVLFTPGLKVDLVFATIPAEMAKTAHLQQIIDASPYQFVYQRGIRVLMDKSASQNQAPITIPPIPPAAHPGQAEFSVTANQVLLGATRVARMVKQGDFLRARQILECTLRPRLITMIEWHARARRGLDLDTWHDGRFMAEWADPRAVAGLPETFAGKEAEDLWRALLALLRLFRQLGTETAICLALEYPVKADRQIAAWIESTRLQV